MGGSQKGSRPQTLSTETHGQHSIKDAPLEAVLSWNGVRDLQNICASVSMACDDRRQFIARKVAETLELGSSLTRGVKLPHFTFEPLHRAKDNAEKDGKLRFLTFLSLSPSSCSEGALNSNAASGDKLIQRRRTRGHNANGHRRDPSVIIWWSAVNHLALTLPRLRFNPLPKPLSGLTAWRSNAHIHFSHIDSLLAPLAALARALRSLPWAPSVLDSGVLCFARIKPLRVREAPTPASRR